MPLVPLMLRIGSKARREVGSWFRGGVEKFRSRVPHSAKGNEGRRGKGLVLARVAQCRRQVPKKDAARLLRYGVSTAPSLTPHRGLIRRDQRRCLRLKVASNQANPQLADLSRTANDARLPQSDRREQ